MILGRVSITCAPLTYTGEVDPFHQGYCQAHISSSAGPEGVEACRQNGSGPCREQEKGQDNDDGGSDGGESRDDEAGARTHPLSFLLFFFVVERPYSIERLLCLNDCTLLSARFLAGFSRCRRLSDARRVPRLRPSPCPRRPPCSIRRPRTPPDGSWFRIILSSSLQSWAGGRPGQNLMMMEPSMLKIRREGNCALQDSDSFCVLSPRAYRLQQIWPAAHRQERLLPR